MHIYKSFTKYTTLNILAMIGMSCYILADTFFISRSAGTKGVAALNLILPVYNLIFAIGSMLATGAATHFTICRAKGLSHFQEYFSNAVLWAIFFSLFFVFAGIVCPHKIIQILGGNGEIIEIGTTYTRIFMIFAPAFMLNFIWTAFTRNDNSPSLAMAATLISNFSNIVLDYIFMFPLHMGMSGAALATGISPLISISICSLHFLSKKNQIHFHFHLPSFKRLWEMCSLGVSGFVGELSSGVTTTVFNFIMLKLMGNVGVAAYGVIANFAIVATSVFNGLAQGSQPLLSRFYGEGNQAAVKKVLKLALITGFCISVLLLSTVFLFTDSLVSIFNSEHSSKLAEYSYIGMRLYFPGFLIAGLNIVGIGFLSATEQAAPAMTAALLRGVFAITGFAFLLSFLFGIKGAWLAFPASELITGIVTGTALFKNQKNL